MKKIIVNILFLIALVITTNAQSTDSSILVPSPFNSVTTQNREVSTAIALGAGEYWHMPLSVTNQTDEVHARFRARGGSKNDVEIFLWIRMDLKIGETVTQSQRTIILSGLLLEL